MPADLRPKPPKKCTLCITPEMLFIIVFIMLFIIAITIAWTNIYINYYYAPLP